MRIQKKGWIVTLALMLVMTMFLAACGAKEGANSSSPAPSSDSTATPTPAPSASDEPKNSEPDKETKPYEGKKLKVGMVTDVGGVNDNSFNQSAWEGLQEFDKYTGSKSSYLQSTGDADYEPNLNEFVKQGYDLTWGIGFVIADAIKKVADENPNAKLAIIDNEVDAPNVASVLFKEHEGSFLVGVVAGLMTKTDRIGFVGGMKIPVIERFEAGFVAGIKAVNPDAKIDIVYTGKFDAPAEGKNTAATMYDNKADIIFHAAGATGDGVFNEGIERKKKDPNVWVIGVDKDQALTFGHEITLTSMMKYVDQAVQKVSVDLGNDQFKAGIVELGLKDNGVGLPPNNPNVPQDVLDKVKEFEQKIIAGEIVVPEKPEKPEK